MALVVLIIWLAETANGEVILEIVDILSSLACVQHHCQRVEIKEHEPLCGSHTINFKPAWL